MIAYEINPDSANVVVDNVLDVRPIEYDERGRYALPEDLNGRHFVKQLGIVLKEGVALIYLQPPPDIYIPDFEHGPITNKIIIKTQQEKLSGDHGRFPNMPKFRDVYERELTEDSMPHVSKETFDVLCSYLNGREELDWHDINECMKKGDFYRGLVSVFESVGFAHNLRVSTVL